MALVSLGTSTISILNPILNLSTVRDNKISNNLIKIRMDNFELNSSTSIPNNTTSTTTLQIGKITGNKISYVDYELSSGITVTNTAVGSTLRVKNDSKISVFDKKTLKFDQLKPSEFKITGNLYNAGSLPTVPLLGLSKNYKPTARPRPEKLRVNFAFTNTQILAITQLYSPKAIKSKIPASNQENLSPIKVSKLTNTTSTLLTSYSYWV